MSATYVYGVIAAPGRVPTGGGIRRRRLRTVREGELAAIVSDVPDEPLEAGREELIAHARVLERAHELGTVLPMRFGVLLQDEQAVRQELLADHHDELALQLQELQGTAELRLRAVYEEGALMSEILAAHEPIATLSQQLRELPADAAYYRRIELGQLVAQAVELAAQADLEAILAELEALAIAVEIEPPEHERVAANISFLVESSRIADFDAAVDELGRRNAGRLTFRYTGPLPAYSFVRLPEQG